MRKLITLMGFFSLFGLILSCDNNDNFKEKLQREQQIKRTEKIKTHKINTIKPLYKGDKDSDLDKNSGK